jgi:predicted Zn-dependent peptidase
MTNTARQKLGGVYGISANVQTSPFPSGGVLESQIYFTCSPARADELSTAALKEMERVAAGDIDAKNFSDALKACVKSFETSMQSNAYIGRRLANYAVVFAVPLGELRKKAEYYAKVTPADITSLVKALDTRKLVKVMLVPEKAKAKQQ